MVFETNRNVPVPVCLLIRALLGMTWLAISQSDKLGNNNRLYGGKNHQTELLLHAISTTQP